MKRLARVKISLEFLAMVLRCDVMTSAVSTNAPKDLKIVRVYNDLSAFDCTAWIIAESEEFEPVAEGAVIPEIESFKYETTQ